MNNKIIKVTGLMLALTSCASMNTQPPIQSEIIVEKSLSAIETSEGNHVVYIHSATDKDLFCAFRGNDFAFTQAKGLAFSAKNGPTSLGASSNTSSGIAELGGINSGVLLTREVMYRTCEFMANLRVIKGLSHEDAKDIFRNSLNLILKISTEYKNSPETEQMNLSLTSPVTSVE